MTRIASALRRLGLLTGAVAFSCAQPAVAPTLDASDASPGVLRSYSCTVADGGPAWTCKDVNGTTCAGYGCVPTP